MEAFNPSSKDSMTEEQEWDVGRKLSIRVLVNTHKLRIHIYAKDLFDELVKMI